MTPQDGRYPKQSVGGSRDAIDRIVTRKGKGDAPAADDPKRHGHPGEASAPENDRPAR